MGTHFFYMHLNFKVRILSKSVKNYTKINLIFDKIDFVF
jgi:hypothetical protein